MYEKNLYTSLSNFEREDGSTDWTAYKKAQKSTGEICTDCGNYIMFPQGFARKCYKCESFSSDSGSISHDRFIRCPKCAKKMEVEELAECYIFEEGEHDIYCECCEAKFTVTTYISHLFYSPPLIKEEKLEEYECTSEEEEEEENE